MPCLNGYHRGVCFCCQCLRGNFEPVLFVLQFSPKKWIQFRSRISSQKWLNTFLGAFEGLHGLQVTFIWCKMLRSQHVCLFKWWQVLQLQASLELIEAQFFLFGSMARTMFSDNPHVQHLMNTQLAQGAQELRGQGKVYTLKLGSEKIIRQQILQWRQSTGPEHEHL